MDRKKMNWLFTIDDDGVMCTSDARLDAEAGRGTEAAQ